MILKQIILGITIIVISVIIQVIFIELAAKTLRKAYGSPRPSNPVFSKFVVTVSSITLWLLMGILVIVALWTIVFMQISVFTEWEESFYFSLVAFTTLGFGDVILPEEWRTLSGFVATDGFLLFGLNTAVLMEVIFRLRGDSQADQ